MTFKDFINHSRTLQRCFRFLKNCVNDLKTVFCNLKTDYQPTISQSAPNLVAIL